MTCKYDVLDVLSIDIDYCQNEQDLRAIVNLFTKALLYFRDLRNDGQEIINFSFSQTHSDIVSVLKGHSKLNVYNIDHHHDIYYDPRHLLMFENGIVEENNWVGWLFRSQLIEKYHWIKNSDSELPSNKDMLDLQPHSSALMVDDCDYSGKRSVDYSNDGVYKPRGSIAYYNSIEDADINPSRLGEVFVCMSPEYLKKEFHYLYFLLIDLASNILGEHSIKIFKP
jgi:hypothetical protein|tara:strand:+ start:1202 stop:1876 length:675 start_codon:yes stop_codon:yes gene_type:complete